MLATRGCQSRLLSACRRPRQRKCVGGRRSASIACVSSAVAVASSARPPAPPSPASPPTTTQRKCALSSCASAERTRATPPTARATAAQLALALALALTLSLSLSLAFPLALGLQEARASSVSKPPNAWYTRPLVRAMQREAGLKRDTRKGAA